MATARTLDQIIAELNPTYQPQIQSIQNQMGLIPGQIQTQETALNAQKDQGYADILSGARRRGTGVAFGGIPLAEQARYNATTYAPALANLRTAGTQQATSLQDAINAIMERRDTNAQTIRNTEVGRDYEAGQAQIGRDYEAQQAQIARDWNAQQNELTRQSQDRAAAISAASQFNPSNLSSYFDKLTTTPQSTLPQIKRDAKGGYNFTDAYGTPVTAAEYTQLYQSQGGQLSYRQLLQQMANEGDSNAKIGLQYVGDDARFGNAPAQYKGALGAIGATGTFGKNTTAPAGTGTVLKKPATKSYAPTSLTSPFNIPGRIF